MALRGSFKLLFFIYILDTLLSTSNFSQRNPPGLETSNFNGSNINLKKSGLSNSIPVSGVLKNQTKTSSLAASCYQSKV